MPPRIGTAAYLKQRYRTDPAFANKAKAAAYKRMLAKGSIVRPGAETLQRYGLGGLARELGLKASVPHTGLSAPVQLSLVLWQTDPINGSVAPDTEAHAAQHLGGTLAEV